jgi:ATP-dependent RNA helicase DDX56/DBP9
VYIDSVSPHFKNESKKVVDEGKLWKKIEQKQNNWSKETASTPLEERPESCIKPFVLQPSLLSGFRYRMEDALRSVTPKAVKEARIKELKAEVLNSGKLKVCFLPDACTFITY